MHIPAFILEHPLESLIAGILLLVLAFGSSDRHAAEVAKNRPASQLAVAGKM